MGVNLAQLPFEFSKLRLSKDYQLSDRRCMVIGNYGENHNAEQLSKSIESLGWYVCKVCWYRELHGVRVDVDFCISAFTGVKETKQLMYHEKNLKLSKILDLSDSNFDFVVIIQNDLTYDLSDVKIPVMYYYTEILHPYLPEDVDWLIWAYPGGELTLARCFPHAFTQVKFKTYLPHAVNLDIFRPEEKENWDDRKHLFAFKGVFNFPSIGDYLQDNLYNLREEFLPVAEKLGLYYPKEGTMWTKEYSDFMKNTKIALNIPGLYGGINQRMFEALASKCILLNYHVDGMEQIGFIDKVTCYTFKNKKELKEKYKYIVDNIEEAKKVAQKGYDIVNANHGYIQRAMMFIFLFFSRKNEYFKNK